VAAARFALLCQCSPPTTTAIARRRSGLYCRLSTDLLLFAFVHAGCAHVSLASRTSQRLTNVYLNFVHIQSLQPSPPPPTVRCQYRPPRYHPLHWTSRVGHLVTEVHHQHNSIVRAAASSCPSSTTRRATAAGAVCQPSLGASFRTRPRLRSSAAAAAVAVAPAAEACAAAAAAAAAAVAAACRSAHFGPPPSTASQPPPPPPPSLPGSRFVVTEGGFAARRCDCANSAQQELARPIDSTQRTGVARVLPTSPRPGGPRPQLWAVGGRAACLRHGPLFHCASVWYTCAACCMSFPFHSPCLLSEPEPPPHTCDPGPSPLAFWYQQGPAYQLQTAGETAGCGRYLPRICVPLAGRYLPRMCVPLAGRYLPRMCVSSQCLSVWR
jgi:hypothetical protein